MPNEEKPDQYSSPMQFPCDFMVKVMGKDTTEFNDAVGEIIQSHFPDVDLATMTRRQSDKGAYAALTITVLAESQAQLDDLYRALSSCEHVVMAL